MARLIDADALKRYYIDEMNFFPAMVKNAIDKQPTIEAETVKHGKWIDGFFKNTFECSLCVENGVCQCYETKMNYCPNCGARMDKEEEQA